MCRVSLVAVGLTGASGALLALTVLDKLAQRGFGIALLLSDNAATVVKLELGLSKSDLIKAATFVVDSVDDLRLEGLRSLIVVPCSVKTLAGIAWGRTDTLLLKLANKVLNAGIRTVLVVRETPWSLIHLRNMLRACERGAVIMPPTIQPKPNQKQLKEVVAELADKIIDLSLKVV